MTKSNRPTMPPPPPECPPAPVHKRKPPTVYRPEMATTVVDMSRQGYGVQDIIEALGINSTSNTNWKRKYPAYLAAWERHSKLVSEFYTEVDRRRNKMLVAGNTNLYTPDRTQELYDSDDFTMSRVEIAAAFRVSKRTLQNWSERYVEFAEALEWYDTMSEAYYMKAVGEFGFLPSKLSQPRLVTFSMAQRFGMTEKVEIETNTNTPPPPQVVINAVPANKPST